MRVKKFVDQKKLIMYVMANVRRTIFPVREPVLTSIYSAMGHASQSLSITCVMVNVLKTTLPAMTNVQQLRNLKNVESPVWPRMIQLNLNVMGNASMQVNLAKVHVAR
jgi:hypothetical protein